MAPLYEEIQVTIGCFEGHPIVSIISVEDQIEAAKYGLTPKDLIEMEKRANNNWLSEC